MSHEQFSPSPDPPPPWIISQPPPPPGQRPNRGRGALLVVAGAAVAALLILGGGGAWWLLRAGTSDPPPPVAVEFSPDDSGAADPVQPPQEPATTPELPTDEPGNESVDAEVVALDRLEELARQGLSEVVLDGRYVAQLASKYPGIHDPLQTTAGGSHTFRATDILDEHERLRDDPANSPARVVLLRSDEYGKRQLVGGRPLYVTFALGDFPGAADVRAWCAERFPDLSAEARANQCAVRRLRPPA